MNRFPTTFRELLEHLADNPRLLASCDDPRVTGLGLIRFTRQAQGGLWFYSAVDGRHHYTPIDCGKTPAETGVTFCPGWFEVEKFGVTIVYKYVENDDAKAQA